MQCFESCTTPYTSLRANKGSVRLPSVHSSLDQASQMMDGIMLGLPIRCFGIVVVITSIIGSPLTGIAGNKRCRCQDTAGGRNAGQQSRPRNSGDTPTVNSPFTGNAPQQNQGPPANSGIPSAGVDNTASDQRHTAISANLKASGKLLAGLLREPSNDKLKASVEAALKVETPPQSLVDAFLKAYPE